MCPVDTSFYPTQQYQPQNPIETFGQLAGIRNALTENQLLQQHSIQNQRQLGIQQATADALNDPANKNPDGTPNMSNVRNKLLQTDEGRMALFQAQEGFNTAFPTQQYMGMKNGQPTPGMGLQSNLLSQNVPGQAPKPQVSQQQIDDFHDHLDAMDSIATPLANNPNPTPKDVIGAVSDAVAHPKTQFSGQDGAAIYMNADLSSPQSIRQGAQQVSAKVNATRQQLAQQGLLSTSQKQTMQQQQNGGPITMTDLPPPGQGKSVSPEMIAEQGSPTTMTSAAPQQPMGMNTIQATSPQQGGPAQLQGPAGGFATGAPLGYAENQQTMYQHYNDVQNKAVGANQLGAVYDEALDLVNKGTLTGTKISSLVQAFAKTGVAPEIVNSNASDYQKLSKLLNMAAIQGGMPASDARLAFTEESNPNPQQLSAAIKGIIPFAKATNVDVPLAQAKFYQKIAGTNNGQNPQNVAQARNTWAQTYDPRVFQAINAAPADRQKLISQMSPQEFKEFSTHYRAMQQAGIVTNGQ